MRLTGWLKRCDRALSEGFLFRGSQILAAIAGVVVGVLMIVNLVGVLGRHSPWAGPWLAGGYELSELLMAMTIALAVAYCWYAGGHIRVEMFRDRGGPRTKAVLDTVSSFVAIVWVAAVVWSVWGMSEVNRLNDARTNTGQIPVAPFQIVFALVMAHFGLVLFRSFLGFAAKIQSRGRTSQNRVESLK